METIVADALSAQIREIERCEPGVRAGNDTEAVHDYRVAVRRLRAAMRAFRTVLPESVLAVEAEARWLGRVIGLARDRDVQIEALRSAAEEDEDLETLVGELLRERHLVQARLAQALDSPEATRLLAVLRTSGIASDALNADEIAKSARRKVRQAARDLAEDSPATDFHHLRKRIKRQRYVLEFLRPVLGDEAETAIDDLKALQDELGERQDAAVLAETVRRLLHEPDLSPEAVHAGERLLTDLETRERKARRRVLRSL